MLGLLRKQPVLYPERVVSSGNVGTVKEAASAVPWEGGQLR